MELFVIRHAIAEDGSNDDARRLTAKGRERFTAMVRMLERLEVRFDWVLHSPKRRAIETAELVAPLVDGELEVTELLAERPSKALFALLEATSDRGAHSNRVRGGERIAVVGHEPHLSTLVAWLLTGTPDGADIELKKGAIARLEGRPVPGGMRLRALLPPRVAR